MVKLSKTTALLSSLVAMTITSSALAAAPKPSKILILSTGGTIAGTANADRSAIGYDPGKLSASDIVKSVPGITKLAHIKAEQAANISSQNMTYSLWHKLADRISKACAKHEADGAVITHGTDTMEETAFFLDNVLPSSCPVVLTASMRPSTAISADGPSNLYEAVKVAASKQAKHRGVMIVMNDEIHSARWTSKTNTTSLQTFKSQTHGVEGYVDPASIRFLDGPERKKSKPLYKLPAQMPPVEIIYAHTDMDSSQVDFWVSRGVKGIILAGVGDGNGSTATIEALRRAHDKGVMIVRSSHVGTGFVNRNIELNDDGYGFIVSYDLNPQKARILTQLIIANGKAHEPLSKLQSRFSYKTNQL